MWEYSLSCLSWGVSSIESPGPKGALNQSPNLLFPVYENGRQGVSTQNNGFLSKHLSDLFESIPRTHVTSLSDGYYSFNFLLYNFSVTVLILDGFNFFLLPSGFSDSYFLNYL